MSLNLYIENPNNHSTYYRTDYNKNTAYFINQSLGFSDDVAHKLKIEPNKLSETQRLAYRHQAVLNFARLIGKQMFWDIYGYLNFLTMVRENEKFDKTELDQFNPDFFDFVTIFENLQIDQKQLNLLKEALVDATQPLYEQLDAKVNRPKYKIVKDIQTFYQVGGPILNVINNFINTLLVPALEYNLDYDRDEVKYMPRNNTNDETKFPFQQRTQSLDHLNNIIAGLNIFENCDSPAYYDWVENMKLNLFNTPFTDSDEFQKLQTFAEDKDNDFEAIRFNI